jgi:EAL domain-containing protein (putative c-di-GMP-specific phosphodiesterase class I)
VTDPGFPAVIAEFLRAEQVPGPMLALEVSEQTGTSAASSSFFAQLAELGVRVALDDFGTGFASLESLGGWPVNELKLDMSLVRPIASNASFRTIVRTTRRPRSPARRHGRGRRGGVRGGLVRTAGPRL